MAANVQSNVQNPKIEKVKTRRLNYQRRGVGGVASFVIVAIVSYILLGQSGPGFMALNVFVFGLAVIALVSAIYKRPTIGGWIISFLLVFTVLASVSIDSSIGPTSVTAGWVLLGTIPVLTVILPQKAFRFVAISLVIVYAVVFYLIYSQVGIFQQTAQSNLVIAAIVASLQLIISILNRNESDVNFNLVLDALHETEDALQEQKKQTEITQGALRAREIFLGILSHELRTPLGRISGFLEMLPMAAEMDLGLSSEQTAGIVKLSEPIAQNVGELTEMLTSLLDLTRIGSGKHEVTITPTTIDELMSFVTHFQKEAEQKGITLNVKTGGAKEFRTDLQMLKTICRNLVSNGIKYTREGTVGITVWVSPDQVSVQVSDTGIGMSSQTLARVFEPFYRAPDAKFEAKGTGIGFSIIEAYVKALGGKIDVKSTEGKGTTVTVNIPHPQPKTDQ